MEWCGLGVIQRSFFWNKRKGKGQKKMGNERPTITKPIDTYGTSTGVGKLLAVEGVEMAIMVKDEKR